MEVTANVSLERTREIEDAIVRGANRSRFIENEAEGRVWDRLSAQIDMMPEGQFVDVPNDIPDMDYGAHMYPDEADPEQIALTMTSDEVALAVWREAEHPRDHDGKFTDKPDGGLGKVFEKALKAVTETYAKPGGRGTAHFKFYADGTAEYVNARLEKTKLKPEVARRRIKKLGFER